MENVALLVFCRYGCRNNGEFLGNTWSNWRAISLMHHKTWTTLRDGSLLATLAVAVVGLVALVSSGSPSPRLSPAPKPTAVARGNMPPVTFTIKQSETRNASRLMAAFDRIGYDLDAVAAGYISVPRVLLAALPPDIDDIDGLDARKALFLRTLLPVVLSVNDHIGADRAHLLKVREIINSGAALSTEDVQWVMSLADAYDQPDADLDALVKKVDVIPPSLTLAQAIVESGWGTSRIAREQNALFGQFGEDESGQYAYRNFTSLSEAVESYALNLNTHRAYREFRHARSRMRVKSGEIDGFQLAATMHRYSERGSEYVDSLRSIMNANSLDAFDAARLNTRSVATIVASNVR